MWGCLRTPGGTPRTTGIWYDDSYDRSLSPPLDASDLANGRNGNANCSVTGTEVKAQRRTHERHLHTMILVT